MIASRFLPCIGAGLLLLNQGCLPEFTLREKVELVMPVVPGHAVLKFGVPSFLVIFGDPEGEVLELPVPEGVLSVEVFLPVKPVLPVLARPVFAGNDRVLLPAGALYPAEVDSRGRLSFTWENGFAADLLLRLGSAGFPLNKFNAPRFFKETLVRGEGNPWHLDDEKIISALQDLSFRADKIKLKKTYPVSLSLPGDTWFSRNVLTPLRWTGEDGFCHFGYLPEGYHRFYPEGRAGGKLDIQIEEDGAIQYILSGNR